MLTLDHPSLIFWRSQPANTQLTDERILPAIEYGNRFAKERAAPDATVGCHAAIALFYVRFAFADDPSDRKLLRDAMDMLLPMEGGTC